MMALIPTVTGIDPTHRYIRANLSLTDDGVEVANKDVQARFNPAVGPTARTKKELTRKAQAVIDRYKAIQATKALPAFSSVFGQIQNDLEV